MFLPDTRLIEAKLEEFREISGKAYPSFFANPVCGRELFTAGSPPKCLNHLNAEPTTCGRRL